MKIGVIGAGSYGTALAVQAARAGHDVMLWARRAELADDLLARRCNRIYLPDCELPSALQPTAELADLVDCPVLLGAIPSHGFRAVISQFLGLLPSDAQPVIVSATKGIETETLARMSEVVFEEAVAAQRDVRFAVLGGPSFAAELAAGMPTAAVIAATDAKLAAFLRDTLSGSNLRLYSSTDVTGVELGGTSKNVIAIAAGVVAGLGLGSNTSAVLLTRGLHEITRLVRACGGRPRTMAGLAGMGDLVLTCTGGLSRNRQLGEKLAAGQTLESISGSTTMVAEGVRNSIAVARLAERHGVEMPITEQMVEVLHRGKPANRVIDDLMNRELKSEAEL